jgi:hypothetical protein
VPTYEPTLKIVHAFLNPEIRKTLSLPLAVLITGALSQVESTMELTNRVYDSYFTGQTSRRLTRRSVRSEKRFLANDVNARTLPANP